MTPTAFPVGPARRGADGGRGVHLPPEDKACNKRAEKRLGGADSVASIRLATPPGSPVADYTFTVQIKLPASAKTIVN